MLDSFAFSTQMQIILFLVACTKAFVLYWLITDLMLTIFGVEVSARKKAIFVFITGVVLNNFWIYGIYLVGGMVSFSPIIYQLVTVPNPIFAAMFYWLGYQVLGMSPYRSVRIITPMYAYILAIKLLDRYIGNFYFAQSPGAYNYLLDAQSLVVCSVVNVVFYLLTKALIHRHRYIIRLSDGIFTTPLRREIRNGLLIATAVYFFVVVTPNFFPGNSHIYLLITTMLALFVCNLALADTQKVTQVELDNRDAYIRTLSNAVIEYNGIRHDLNNMLQAFSGLIALGDIDRLKAYQESLLRTTQQASIPLELNRYMNDNPALISLLANKIDEAKDLSVALLVTIHCDVQDMYIENIDLCRSLGCLLDDAIAAAAKSQGKWIHCSIEPQHGGDKLIIVTNALESHVERTSARTTRGTGLSFAQRTLAKYGNCTLQYASYMDERSVYLALRNIARTQS